MKYRRCPKDKSSTYSLFIVFLLACTLQGQGCNRSVLGVEDGLLIVRPTEFDFEEIPVGTSAQMDITLFNEGQVPIEISALSVAGIAASEFTIDTAPFRLNVGQQRALTVFFRPMVGGLREAKILIMHSASGLNPAAIPLSGLGIDCVDFDGDGYGERCAPGPDCDDTNAYIFPGQSELCDGQDNDCDPTTQDGANEPTLGQPCDGIDDDLCNEGAIECIAGAMACSDLSENNLDLCDGMDNDCNPLTLDGADEASLGLSCDGDDDDACEEGILFCDPSAPGLTCSEISDNVGNACEPQPTEPEEPTELTEPTQPAEPVQIGCGHEDTTDRSSLAAIEWEQVVGEVTCDATQFDCNGLACSSGSSPLFDRSLNSLFMTSSGVMLAGAADYHNSNCRTFSGTILRSVDNGRHWEVRSRNLALSPGSFGVRGFAETPDGTLFAATQQGVYTSLNAGVDWNRMVFSEPLASKTIASVGVTPSGNYLLVGTRGPNSGHKGELHRVKRSDLGSELLFDDTGGHWGVVSIQNCGESSTYVATDGDGRGKLRRSDDPDGSDWKVLVNGVNIHSLSVNKSCVAYAGFYNQVRRYCPTEDLLDGSWEMFAHANDYSRVAFNYIEAFLSNGRGAPLLFGGVQGIAVENDAMPAELEQVGTGWPSLTLSRDFVFGNDGHVYVVLMDYGRPTVYRTTTPLDADLLP